MLGKADDVLDLCLGATGPQPRPGDDVVAVADREAPLLRAGGPVGAVVLDQMLARARVAAVGRVAVGLQVAVVGSEDRVDRGLDDRDATDGVGRRRGAGVQLEDVAAGVIAAGDQAVVQPRVGGRLEQEPAVRQVVAPEQALGVAVELGRAQATGVVDRPEDVAVIAAVEVGGEEGLSPRTGDRAPDSAMHRAFEGERASQPGVVSPRRRRCRRHRRPA